MSGGRGLGEMAVQAACALAEVFFPEDAASETAIPLDQAHLIASGRLDLWDGWESQPPDMKALVGQFLRLRHNELASRNAFLAAARRQFATPDAPFTLPAGVPSYEATRVLPRHGGDPIAFVVQVLEDMEDIHARARTPVETAEPGLWSFGWQPESTVDIPETLRDAASHTAWPVVTTAPYLSEIKVSCQEIRDLAEELDRAWGQSWRLPVIGALLAGFRDSADLPVNELVAYAGQLRLANAPTGVGKTVFDRLLAIYLARAGIRSCIVVTNINDALNTEADIRADLGKLYQRTAARVPSCETLLSAHRLHDKALTAADLGDWDRVDKLGYGCALRAQVVDGPLPEPGKEPCTGLRPAAGGSDDNRGNGARHACPWRGGCGRHRLAHRAVQADIIVTYHHMLASGHVPIPVVVDDVEVESLSVLELVMRACPVILIDEIDQFQSTLVEAGSKEVRLAAKGREQADLALAQIETQRDLLPPGSDRRVVPPLRRAQFLSEQFLNYVLEGEIWLEDERDRPASGWHLPGTLDSPVARALFRVPDETEIPAGVYKTYNALFPDREEPVPVDLPDDLRAVAELIRDSVSNDSGGDEIRDIKHRMHEILTARVPDSGGRNDIVNGLLVRAWLGSLRQALTRLTYAVTSPDVQLPGARQLAEKLGVFVQHSAIPYGPLGYLLFGFRVTRSDTPRLQGELSVQAIGGDPHTTTAQLAGVVALAACGFERIVIGLSATAFFPGAAREHIHVPVTWAMTDTAPGGVKANAGTILAGMQPIRIAGLSDGPAKDDVLIELGKRLWSDRLGPYLETALTDQRHDRARALIVGNSYRQAGLLGRGIAAMTDPRRLAIAVSSNNGPVYLALPPGAESLTADQFESFGHGPVGRVLIAPLSRVARGLNILVPGQQISAIASIWVCVRPVAQVHEPAELFASVNSAAIGKGSASADPAAVLAQQRTAAHNRLYWILSCDRRFSLLPRKLKSEVVAGMLVDLIQLAGRARRGGTPVDLFLVDGAFHDPRLSSDLPSLVRYHYENLDEDEQAAMKRVYGGMLTALLEYAGVPGKDGSNDNRA